MNINLSSVPREKKGVIEKITRNCIKIIQRKRGRWTKIETENALENSIKLCISLAVIL